MVDYKVKPLKYDKQCQKFYCLTSTLGIFNKDIQFSNPSTSIKLLY